MESIRRHKFFRRRVGFVWLHLAGIVCGFALTPGIGYLQAGGPTTEYLNTRLGVEYVGDEACRLCHLGQYESFKQTGMGRSMDYPSISDNLGEFVKPVTLHKKELNRFYSSWSEDGKFFHRESQLDAAGNETFSDVRAIAYAVGSGDHGRSYLVRQDDFLFMSPLTFYTSLGKWDLSPGYERGLSRGFSRPIGEGCVFCHSGLPQPVAGTLNRYRQPAFRILAIGCERCHGPGQLHVRQRRAGDPLEEPVDRSIVNPSKLSLPLRDNVCEQCHLEGDARVPRPGKIYLDFRPGKALDDVVAIFSVPPPLKGNRSSAAGQVEQMKLSRCWLASEGRLGCITCHDPHVQPRGAEAVSFFKKRCQTCHTHRSCRQALEIRQATSPPDNCLACHMPRRPLSTLAHTAVTDHRILRLPGNSPRSSSASELAGKTVNLIHDTRRPGQGDAASDLRTRALAYAQVAQFFPVYSTKALQLLRRAARKLPQDKDVQAVFGVVLSEGSPSTQSRRRAAHALEQAIALGSQSPAVRMRLADIRIREGQVTPAIQLLEDTIRFDPYYAPPYLALARLYLRLGDRKNGIDVLERVLKFHPGNETARKELKEARAAP